jgi:uncharacterized protein (DUF1697 family)
MSEVERAPGESTHGQDRYLALLRAVNVGGNNRLAMADLRELLEGLGYGGVRTHLQSGNAVFTASEGSSAERLAGEIETALVEEVGLTVKVLVRTRPELARAIAANPLLDVAEDHARLLVTFLSRTPDPEVLAALAPAEFEPEVFAVGEREIYAWYPEGVRATKLSNAFWERRLGVVASARNWRTVTRLLELMDEG